jgi:hypothetical protein
MVRQANPPSGGTEMTTKIRTAVLTLIAAFSFAVAVAPAAQAESNTGSGEKLDNCYEKAMAIQRNRDRYEAEKKKDPNSFETKEAYHDWGVALDNYERECVKQSATRVLPVHVLPKITQQIAQVRQIAQIHSSTQAAA